MGLLYEVNREIIDIARRAIEVEVGDKIELVDCVTGELITAELESAELTKTDVLLSLAKAIKNLEAESEAIKSEAENLKTRASEKLKKAESLKRVIARFGYQTNVSDAQVAIKWQKGRDKVEILDEGKIPKEYGKELGWKPDKAEILKALKNGTHIDGCALVKSDSTFSIK